MPDVFAVPSKSLLLDWVQTISDLRPQSSSLSLENASK